MPADPRKPTPTMLRVLREMIAGLGSHHQVYGMSAHGGRTRILHGLMRHGLIDREYQVTEEGKKVADAR